jgi:hypothetical protein
MKIARLIGLALLRAVLLTVALTLAVDHWTSVASFPTDDGGQTPPPAAAQALAARFDCGVLPKGVIPAHALVEDADGTVRITSFDEGWHLYTSGSTDSVLLSVCLH